MSSVLRAGVIRNPSETPIKVTCPKCQNVIAVPAVDNAPIRCSKCFYPMIRRTDLLLIVAACKEATNAQVKNAVDILKKLSNAVPEAGTALGFLASRHMLPLDEDTRWNMLISALSNGDNGAQEWLSLMCRSNPETYEATRCKKCGAPKFVKKRARSMTTCIYCLHSDY